MVGGVVGHGVEGYRAPPSAPAIRERADRLGKTVAMSAYQVQRDPTAVMGRRIVAFIIDWVIGFAVMVVGFLALTDSADVPGAGMDLCNDYQEFEGGLTACFVTGDTVRFASDGDALLIYAIPALYFIVIAGTLIQGSTGGTPGKLIMGLRAVDRDTGQTVGYGKAFVRTILWIVDGFPCYLVGLITGLSSKGHRRVGDMAAGTLVVGAADVGQPPQVPGLTPLAATPYGVAGGAPPPGQWGAPAEPTTWSPSQWAPPADPGTGAPPPAPAPAPTPAADGPTWDEARGAYIQWDPELSAWMQWNEAAGAWQPIE